MLLIKTPSINLKASPAGANFRRESTGSLPVNKEDR